MTDEKVSVITTVLNEGDGVRTLLDALLSQSREPDEVVVVDGGSADQTVAILKEYAGRDPRVRYFVDPGVNIARGRNLAIARARYPIVAVTDGGCSPERNWLRELVRPLLEDESFGAVSGGRCVDARTRFEFFGGMLSTSKDPGREETRLFYGRTSAFRKTVWEAAGGYPEWLYTAEDTSFALQARALGCRVAFAPESIVTWRPRPTLRKLAKQYYLYGRGTGRIARGKLGAALYHLRYHALWMATLVLGLAFPWLWAVTAGTLAYLYVTVVWPALKTVRAMSPDPWRELYVPVIVLTRSLCNNLGQVVGLWEYHFAPPFRRNLALYRAGKWKRAGADAR